MMEIGRRSPRHFLGQSHDQCRPQPPEHQQHMTGRTRTPAGWAAKKGRLRLRRNRGVGWKWTLNYGAGGKRGRDTAGGSKDLADYRGSPEVVNRRSLQAK
ncbi:hypothetical protein Ddc_04748 [Ditylenchus destructor]|nr:hypothetical protein Ddc_04748 [Ditylenchus destructor]